MNQKQKCNLETSDYHKFNFAIQGTQKTTSKAISPPKSTNCSIQTQTEK